MLQQWHMMAILQPHPHNIDGDTIIYMSTIQTFLNEKVDTTNPSNKKAHTARFCSPKKQTLPTFLMNKHTLQTIVMINKADTTNFSNEKAHTTNFCSLKKRILQPFLMKKCTLQTFVVSKSGYYKLF